MPTRATPRVVALAGGVGGSRLVAGLARILAPADLVVVVNTGDDFDHLGLRICPDLDTVLHRLAGLHDPDRGWGRRDETWTVLDAISTLDGPDWFRLGDRDLATHLVRSHRLGTGATLSEVTRRQARAWGIEVDVHPMSDDTVATVVRTDDGWQDFQDWFVRQGARPAVHEIAFRGAKTARADPLVVAAITRADLVVVAPSNPFLSIDPIRAVPALGNALEGRSGPTVGISPIIAGRAVRGPAARLLADHGLPVSPVGVAAHLADILTDLVLDGRDRSLADDVAAIGVHPHVLDTMMPDAGAEDRLARETVAALATSS